MGKAEDNKAHKRIALLDNALKLFMEQGTDRTTVSDIAERSGVAKGTFYLYFKDKYDIRNKLIVYESSKMFNRASDGFLKEVRGTEEFEKLGNVEKFKKVLVYMCDNIINQFNENKALLNFISKNLSWAVFKKALTDESNMAEVDFRKIYRHLITETEVKIKNPEILLFMITELVGSTCYSSILYSDPVDIETLKPFIFDTIENIIDSQLEK